MLLPSSAPTQETKKKAPKATSNDFRQRIPAWATNPTHKESPIKRSNGNWVIPLNTAPSKALDPTQMA
jgi:hypothetical protein